MTSPTSDQSGRNSLSDGGWGMTGTVRLAIGLVQGLILAWLIHSTEDTRSWPATVPELFGPLLLIAAYLPVVALAGVGRLRLVTLLAWIGGAAVLLALLGWSDVARQSAEGLSNPPFLDLPLFPFAAVALFITHHLVLPADRERRLLASFPAYFDTAWLAGVQLVLSLGFALAFWLLLVLGGALFNLIGIRLLNDLLQESWFVIPVVSVAFALAVQLTDVRPGLIRGVRTVALMLLSWLLLVITVLVGGFLAALPFTGMEGLWNTGSATALVLSAAGALVILINTAYQDGEPDNRPPAALRGAARVASVLLTPLMAISVWGLSLRIGQHGLTPDRIIASACVVVGIAYAGGYGFAALSPFWRRGAEWMKPLERTNVAAAVLTVLVIVALFTPIADPARLSVADQTARLERGAVTPARFDFAFLRFESGKAGEKALARLARSDNPEIARRAQEAQKADNAYTMRDASPPDFIPAIEAWPQGSALPAGFTAPTKGSDARRRCEADDACVATTMDLNGDGAPEVLLANRFVIEMYARRPDGTWESQGSYGPQRCNGRDQTDPRDALKRGALHPSPTAWPDLSLGGIPLQLDDTLRCRRAADAAAG